MPEPHSNKWVSLPRKPDGLVHPILTLQDCGPGFKASPIRQVEAPSYDDSCEAETGNAGSLWNQGQKACESKPRSFARSTQRPNAGCKNELKTRQRSPKRDQRRQPKVGPPVPSGRRPLRHSQEERAFFSAKSDWSCSN